MPIFEYICQSCECNFEVLEKSSKKAKNICPQCGSTNVAKKLSVFNPAVKQGQSKRCRQCTDFSCPHSQT